ncbi:MAG: hypothetical protein PVSMB8_00190 [Vulcanimicrobiaceae bacterium]
MPSPPELLTAVWCADCGRHIYIGTRAKAAEAGLAHGHPIGFERYHREARGDALPEKQPRRGSIDTRSKTFLDRCDQTIAEDVVVGRRCSRCKRVITERRKVGRRHPMGALVICCECIEKGNAAT